MERRGSVREDKCDTSTVALSRGRSEVLVGCTKCTSVPSEGSNVLVATEFRVECSASGAERRGSFYIQRPRHDGGQRWLATGGGMSVRV